MKHRSPFLTGLAHRLNLAIEYSITPDCSGRLRSIRPDSLASLCLFQRPFRFAAGVSVPVDEVTIPGPAELCKPIFKLSKISY
jgi:hypothetical protein